MVSKVLVFVLAGLGMLVCLGFLFAAIPQVQRTAFLMANHVITYAHCLGAMSVGVVFYLASKA